MCKMILTSISSFPVLTNGSYRFVDKRLLIRNLIRLGEGVCIFTHPHRFGTTICTAHTVS